MNNRDQLFAYGMCVLSLALVVSFLTMCAGGVIMILKGYEAGYQIANAGAFAFLPLLIFFGIFSFVAMNGEPDQPAPNLVDDFG